MYTYGWFMLRFDRKQQNSVELLSFNKKWINLKKIRNKTKKMKNKKECTNWDLSEVWMYMNLYIYSHLESHKQFWLE